MTGRTLFLHVGLPKCASSALQDWAGTNRALLAAQGITWPGCDPDGPMAARHQWLVATLRHGEPDRLAAVLADAPGDVLMSAEGLSRHFHEMPAQRLAAFRDVTAGWDVRLILMTRDLTDWQRSMWKQCMINPSGHDMNDALALGLADFAALPSIQRLTGVARLGRELAAGYGARDLVRIDADGDWLRILARLIDIDVSAAGTPPRRHESFPDTAIPVVQAINAAGRANGQRDALLALMQLAMGTRDDSLRLIAGVHEPALAGRRRALAHTLAAIGADLDDDPRAAFIIHEMRERLDELPAQEAAG